MKEAFILVFLLTAQIAGALTYTMKELPGLPGAGAGRGAAAINDKGQIAGTMKDAQGNERAVVWDGKGNIKDLGTLSGHCISWALDINDLGQVVGWSSEAGNRNKHAVLWEADGRIVDLAPQGTWLSEAKSINNKRHVIGYYRVKEEDGRPFIWKPGVGMSDLADPPGCVYVSAEDIDDSGRIVGRCSNSGSYHAVVWEPDGTVKDLSPLLGMANCTATAINSRGQITAKECIMCFKGNAFLWDPKGGVTDLGRLPNLPKSTALSNPPPVPQSNALALNDLGQVVGWSEDERTTSHAFFWSKETGMVDLGALVDREYRERLKGMIPLLGSLEGHDWSSASDINNSGVIVGSSSGRAVIWVPAP